MDLEDADVRVKFVLHVNWSTTDSTTRRRVGIWTPLAKCRRRQTRPGRRYQRTANTVTSAET